MGKQTHERQVIGEDVCPYCQSRVPIRLDKGNKGYWNCNGQIEGQGCGRKANLGHAESRELLTAHLATQNPTTTTPDEKDAANDNAEPERRATGSYDDYL